MKMVSEAAQYFMEMDSNTIRRLNLSSRVKASMAEIVWQIVDEMNGSRRTT